MSIYTKDIEDSPHVFDASGALYTAFAGRATGPDGRLKLDACTICGSQLHSTRYHESAATAQDRDVEESAVSAKLYALNRFDELIPVGASFGRVR